MTEVTARETELRERALKRVKKRRDFYAHVMVYLLVNTFLVVIWWATTGLDGFFWPVFPIVGWGIGVVMNAWDVYVGEDVSEADIQREIEHMEHQR